MNRIRWIFFSLLVITGSTLIFVLTKAKIRLPYESTLAPAFQLLGRPVKRMDRALTKVLPVDNIDEKEYGEAIALRYEQYNSGTAADQAYIQSLIEHVSADASKGFRYKALIIDDISPNAFALPGGVVVVTAGLLETLQSESELVAVLAHEVGHVELSHCLDSVRMEIVANKIGSAPLGELADMAMTMMMRHTYSKTQEDEADEYAWAWIRNSQYAPSGHGLSFGRLIEYDRPDVDGGSNEAETQRAPHPISEYFQSHPHLEHRKEKFSERARVWRKQHSDEERCIGRNHLKNRSAMHESDYDANEWSRTE